MSRTPGAQEPRAGTEPACSCGQRASGQRKGKQLGLCGAGPPASLSFPLPTPNLIPRICHLSPDLPRQSPNWSPFVRSNPHHSPPSTLCIMLGLKYRSHCSSDVRGDPSARPAVPHVAWPSLAHAHLIHTAPFFPFPSHMLLPCPLKARSCQLCTCCYFLLESSLPPAPNPLCTTPLHPDCHPHPTELQKPSRPPPAPSPANIPLPQALHALWPGSFTALTLIHVIAGYFPEPIKQGRS